MQQENVVAQQTCPEETGIDCAKHDGPAANSSGPASPLAKRIRGLREGAGMSQARLAELVLVSRQTVINWEKGRTLPDAESLKRLSAAFGITLDALLDERSEEYLRQTARDRRAIKVAIALNCLWMLEILVGIVVTSIAHKFLSPDQAYAISDTENIVHLSIMIASIVASWKMQGIKIEHNLESAVDVAAFLEGYEPGSALPQTFVWRWLLPHWTLVTTVLSICAIAWTFVLLIALKLA
ncbi:helix-turn-helix domain-containing protein [Collinsella intestinalis]|uniref:helix-turn-helix domain-containing protein n=1 Tax=Collinsella intestinalis TaxID=147207 RepID=UPI0022E092AD|nr:helix-turn-helix transcriptional regulator [Collinsella intestinalis]